MKKVVKIEGMTCNHCKSRVEDTLNKIEGISAKVNLSKKEAVVSIKGDIDDKTLTDAITEAGYSVVSIKEKKGLFG